MESKYKEKYEKYKNIVPKLPKSTEDCTIIMPDGKEHKIPIVKGTGGPPMIDIRNLYQLTGCFTYDPGYTATGSCISSITESDGANGELRIRGYPIEELAEKCSYIEVCYLLLYGDLPDVDELAKFEKVVYAALFSLAVV